MRTAVPGEEPRLRLRVWAAEEDDHSAGRAWRGGEALTLDDFTRSIAVAATLSQVEEDLAETLRTMAAQAKGTVAARRLRLAEDAERGAQAAAEHGEHLRQQARRWADHADVVALRHALDHAGTVLAGLARAEDDIADILTHLASRDGSDLSTQRQHLAAQAQAAGQHARDLAQAPHQLAETDAASTQPAPAPRTVGGGAALESALHQRLADIDRRLAELQLARPKPPGDDPPAQVMEDAQRRVRQAQQPSEDGVAHLAQARQLAAEALDRSATAHDRAAEANARSAAAGIGDVAEHNRMAAFHRAAAQADRQRAQEARILSASSSP